MTEKAEKILEWIAKNTICKLFGHGDTYRYTVRSVKDGKVYTTDICKRCWTETTKEVK